MTTPTAHVRWTDLALWTGLDGPGRLGWLDETELDRLAATRDPRRRAELAVSRHLLRGLVGELTAVEPSAVRFGYTCTECGAPHGRPVVRAPGPASGLHVSLTHAGGLVVVAASAAGPVGVDVEPVAAATFTGFDQVALTAGERDRVAALPATDRQRERARIWVRKEALLKAVGSGLRFAPDTIDLDRSAAQRHDLTVAPGFAAAIAILAGSTVELSVRGVRPGPGAATAGPARAASAAAGR